ncbi:hypothetical protein QQS21_007541 [Conoideocrella luteorostrata]|uniref:Zn(2)-C6 fungal-type domain-containing protein n=1 Tax=Conoideocrella luteorostrata TaxID=1105319 RepID=A0AAJ0CKI6_9HYPO|nr:hypothetical protein QQS21_007541 [Conoideocrella luteorostrata]
MVSTTTITVRQLPKATRSLKACRKCHERKVRCDVTKVGPPCSNCRCGKIDCELLDGKRRGRKKRFDLRRNAALNVSNVPSLTQAHFHSHGLDIDTSTPSEHPGPESTLARDEAAVSSASLNHAASPASDASAGLPCYVKPIPKSWNKDEIEFLSVKQVFSLPTPSFRNLCLQSYVEWVHFFCPVLDLETFLASIAQPSLSPPTKVSLILLYAVLLTGVAFVDDCHILEAGYESRMAVRKEFFTKAKLLYSFGYESDRKALAQALLLMSYWQERHDEPTNHWYWAELGCLTARTIGMFTDPSASALPEPTRRSWKRIGWSCILRDRVLNLGVRMPPKVSQQEFRVPILTEDDFEPREFPAEVVEMLPHCELLRDVGLQRRLARMCIEKTKLCMVIGDIFDNLYKQSSPKLGGTLEITLILVPQFEGLDAASVGRIRRDLHDWVRCLPADLQHPQPAEFIIQRKEQVAFVHCSMLHLFYQTIMCTYYRPQSLAAGGGATSRDITAQRVSHATMMITRQFEDLESYGLLRFLPSSAVTFLLTAAVNHLVEYKTIDEEDSRQRHLRRFRDCLCYIKTLQLVHVYAKYGGLFLTSSARQEGIAIAPDALTTFAPTANVPANPTDKEGLGPWAVAHTPDVLLKGPHHRPARTRSMDTHSTIRTPPTYSTAVTANELPVQDMMSHQVSRSNAFNGSEFDVRDMTLQGWIPTTGSGDIESVDLGTLSPSSSFLNSTIWEHGWIDQIAENWLSQLPNAQEDLGHVSLEYPNLQ